jgi:RNA polymerase sigma-70 factor, ECF subfamily
LLTKDAIQVMPPWREWIQGREALRAAFSVEEAWEGEPRPGRFRVVPTALNGHLAFAEYRREGSDNSFAAAALTVVTLNRDRALISELVSFASPALFAALGFPLNIT